MKLSVQIKTLIVSTLFGLFYSFFIDIFDKYLFKLKKIIQLIISISFTIITSFIYFDFLLKINNGIIHPYFVIAFFMGVIFENIFSKFFKRIVLHIKKWYNSFGG